MKSHLVIFKMFLEQRTKDQIPALPEEQQPARIGVMSKGQVDRVAKAELAAADPEVERIVGGPPGKSG